jgi:hypothetical protein
MLYREVVECTPGQLYPVAKTSVVGLFFPNLA